MHINRDRRRFLNWCCLTAVTPLCVTCNESEAVQKGRGFLVNAIAEQRLGLGCFVRGTRQEAPVHDDGWVFSSHFAVLALGEHLPSSLGNSLAARLLEARRDGAWGYGKRAPVDSDDTAFAIRTLRLLGHQISLEALVPFRVAERDAYKTFLWPSTKRVESGVTVEANTGIHAEVNLNIAALFGQVQRGRPELSRIVDECVGETGEVKSYFYPSPYYGSYWLLAAVRAGAPVALSAQDKVLAFVRASQAADGSWAAGDPYATALALATLRLGGDSGGSRARGQKFLQATQNADGSWQTASVVWQYMLHPQTIWDAFDTHRVVCTALALEALKA